MIARPDGFRVQALPLHGGGRGRRFLARLARQRPPFEFHLELGLLREYLLGRLVQIYNLAIASPKSRLNRTQLCANNAQMIRRCRGIENGQETMGMTEQQERLKRERDEIALRVASFKATQEKFQREREEFFRRAWRKVRNADLPT
jgi:hypothetical protein